ncbi:GH3 domain-containing protein [Petromyzon marinus]|uniref:GH3 domain-containing protein n=2 Tax=Petromyzon marinus TaxID=7757 RepID=A0AAJ7X616_PETMA|nr:GH3 domain-containing protein [Petromyzon marinus]XP_032822591.1 GH3 domain-containing protein [Petromyzon marinus]
MGSFLGIGVATICSAGLACAFALAWDIRQRTVSESHTLGSLLGQYFCYAVMHRLGRWQRKKLEVDTMDVATAQEETLLARLQRNGDTAYGRQHGLDTVRSRRELRERHPLTRYDHYRAYVERVACGELGVLTSQQPSILALTSGTSGHCSMLLSLPSTLREFFLQGVAVILCVMFDTYPEARNLQKVAKLFYMPRWRSSEAGIPVGPNSSSPDSSKGLLSIYSTPGCAFAIASEQEALYVHLLFALRDRRLGSLEANFASLVYHAFSTLEMRWQRSLAEDIELGRVSPNIDLPDDVRSSLNALLRPDPARAEELRRAFAGGFDGIARRIWPRLNLVLAVDSGSNEPYGRALENHYCRGVPLYSPLYGATEGLIGVNLWPERRERRYLLCPRAMVCEFIPVQHAEQEQPGTLLMEEVQEGQVYELVLTNGSGLYRYRFGDVIQVVGFHNRCPIVEFMYRQGMMLNVRGEKTSEGLFDRVMKRTARIWAGSELLDYCCAESGLLGNSAGTSDPHYEVFVEVKGTQYLSDEKRNKLDQFLQEESAVYKSFRNKGSIGPARVNLIHQGAFQDLKKYALEKSGASPNQYKTPRVLKNKEQVDILLQRCIA